MTAQLVPQPLHAGLDAHGAEPPRVAGTLPDGVSFDTPGDGHLWAVGSTYKASFGADGFVYVPFFGSSAPRNFPVQFVLRSVRADGRSVDFRADAAPSRDGTRVVFDRGAVREIYDILPTSIEQTFVVDVEQSGDVDIDIEIVSELTEDAERAGVQFGNEFGQVDYGTAFLVSGMQRSAIPSGFTGRTLSLHVPAAERRSGPVVIDPIITTRTFAAATVAAEVPDIAYDATTDRWLVTWIRIFSATDHDVLAELRAPDGTPVPGSLRFIDTTQEWFSFPRTANLASVDRFLVAMEKIPQVATGRYTVWGRTMSAHAPFITSSMIEISLPTSSANQNSVDVGGDPGTGTQWMVVWVIGNGLFGAQVNADGTVVRNLSPLLDVGMRYINPQISLSNGNGVTSDPSWCLVFNGMTNNSDWDVYAATIGLDGRWRAAKRRIDSGASTSDLLPMVTSPMTDRSGHTRFMVCWDRQSTPAEMIAMVLDSDAAIVVPEVSLTRRYGFDGTFFRVESDGCRFAAICQSGTTLRVGTLALMPNDIVLQETPQTLATGGWPFLASKHSGGGGSTDYGIAYVDTTFSPFRVAIGLYEGRSALGGFSRRTTGCGLGIDASGRPALAETVHFALTGVGSELAGVLIGLPAPSTPICPSCSLGLDLSGPTLALPASGTLQLPREPSFVGFALTAQGYAIGSGSCLAAFRVSDAIDFLIQ